MATLQTPTALQNRDQLICIVHRYRLLRASKHLPPTLPLPCITSARLSSTSANTVLYLAYGSNLSAETFKGFRGIKPISSINVHVPSLDLTFDLAGIPYNEPCFANTRWRNQKARIPSTSDYHKHRWHKGLVGVVYEVTPEDYRTIIATEGGTASYQDVVVPCYAIPRRTKTVDMIPRGVPFEAHTLLRPEDENDKEVRVYAGGIHRPDPSYAQASARYLKLITDGAEEHALPDEYLHYLHNLRPYTITTTRQKAGQAFIITCWMPLILALVQLSQSLADEDGKSPIWLANIIAIVFTFLWTIYDMLLKPVFGDGERTMKKEDEEDFDGPGEWTEKSSTTNLNG